MRLRNQLYKFIAAFSCFFAVSGCESDFLDVNDDPNRTRNASIDVALPTAMGYAAYSFGNQYQILGGFWAQYWTQGPTANQYNTLEQYIITSDSYDRPWSDLYSGPLRDLKYIIDEGNRMNTDQTIPEDQRIKGANYAAIAKLMQAYIFQMLTDMYGDIPFTQALQGDPADGDNITPAYDSQEAVYDGLIVLADEAIALIDTETDFHPGDDDLIYQGDMEAWLKFAYTLKLKIYLRQSAVRPAVAQAGIQALYAGGAEFLDTDAQVQFYNATFNTNPLFSSFDFLGTSNILASNTVINYLNTNEDPRITVFFKRATTGTSVGQYVGLAQGEGKSRQFPATVAATDFSKPGDPVAGPEAPVVFMSAAESYFLQAEASLRGWGTGDPEALYTAGVEASFDRWGLLEEAEAYLAQPDVAYSQATDKLKAIITQKWVSMTGTEHVEPWTEWRRTGYPDFFTISTYTQIGQVFPVRLLLPSSEETRNPNTPPQQTVTTRLWWDVN